MSVKRYEPIAKYIGTGEYVGDTQFAGDGEYVLHDDYAALEAKACKAGITAGELQAKVNRLEADKARLEQELRITKEEHLAMQKAEVQANAAIERLEAELTRLKEFIERRIEEFKKGPLSNYGEGKRDAFNIVLREIERAQESQAGGR
jgi:hypothetical protein